MTRPVYSDGRVHIMADRCDSCIFRPGDLMKLGRARTADLTRQARSNEGGNIPCHKTTYDQRPQEAICRGYWDAYAHLDNLLRMASRLGIVEEVPV